jgi:hypothetical protein
LTRHKELADDTPKAWLFFCYTAVLNTAAINTEEP